MFQLLTIGQGALWANGKAKEDGCICVDLAFPEMYEKCKRM